MSYIVTCYYSISLMNSLCSVQKRIESDFVVVHRSLIKGGGVGSLYGRCFIFVFAFAKKNASAAGEKIKPDCNSPNTRCICDGICINEFKPPHEGLPGVTMKSVRCM